MLLQKIARTSRLSINRFSHTKSSIPRSYILGTLGVASIIGIGSVFSPIMAEKKSPTPSAAAAVQTPASKEAAGIKGGIERTFIAVKPDGTQRGLIHKVIERFERKGYKLVAMKVYFSNETIVPSKELAGIHYADLKARPFFNGLVSYMTSGAAPVVAMCWEGPDVIRQGRRLIGATNPLDAEPGSIRGDYCISVGRNIIHGSDSFESANIEIPLWFKQEELYDWQFGNAEWVISQN